ncbi:MAG: hypothetical protein KJ556_06115 [Gammaproteobacteria bacterium]|nr:hypothetical protein [Gammaproteobacteria bacterium]MBU2056269.1 hypothetical protein [Gammaproteobacteria bacterium]MBU2174684.1 hypothetical protein [Gammaproteobacteria bacterium]MBU2248845.1 hypothetical protein [Gammaproteobacteria bacterium]MBU2344552.1 hypothetical protein [Gammaproteobacteria bacterium]
MKFKLGALFVALVVTAAPAQADWLNAVKDGASSALKETKDSAKAAALNTSVRTALGLTEGKSTQAAIAEKLGEPASKTEKDGKTLWLYDVTVLSASYPTLTELVKTQEAAQKSVQLSFTADVLNKLELITPAK